MGNLQPTQIANALAGVTTPGERRRLVLQLADEKGVSAQSIYSAAKRGGFISGRSKRADAGTRTIPVTDAQLAQVAKIIHASHTNKGSIPLPAHEAIRLAETQAIIPAGVVSEAYLNQWMRARNVSKRHALQTTPHSRLRSLYPNHVHMIDASQCAQWYLADSGAVKHQRLNMEVYKNKQGDPRKITRLLLVDHYSGAFFAWYVQSETAREWIEFLYFAWADKSFLANRLAPFLPKETIDNLSAWFPFRGVPAMIYADKGSPVTRDVTQNVLNSLGINFDHHLPGNPRAKGANEGMQRHWERWFESRLHLNKATSLDQLNAWAFDCCMAINSTRPHARHGMPRFRLWNRDIEYIKDVPDYDFYRSYALAEPEVREVGNDGVIQFTPPAAGMPKGQYNFYRVPDVNLWGGKVEVAYSLFEFPTVKIINRRTGEFWHAKPLIRDGAGFLTEISAVIGQEFKQPAETEVQKALKQLKAEPMPSLEQVHVSDKHQQLTPAEHQVVAFKAPEEDVVRVYEPIPARRQLLQRLNSSMSELHPAQQAILKDITAKITHQQFLEIYDQLTQFDPNHNIIQLGAQA